MIPQHRRAGILKEIEARESVAVAELAASLGVSEMTIRRDLHELEEDGSIKRVHGGAVLSRGRSYEPPYTLRSTQAVEEKRLIGAAAARLVREGDSLAIDGGSTTYELAREIAGMRNITVITPSLRVAGLFVDKSDIRLIMPGGIVRTGEASMVGDLTAQALQGLFVDKLFMGVACVDEQAGMTEYNWDDALVKRAMIKCAREVTLLADSGKFGKVAFALVGKLDEIDNLVADRQPPDGILEILTQSGARLIIAE